MLGAVVLVAALAATAPQQPPSPRRLVVPRAAAPPRIDGRLDDPAWESAARLEHWVQTQPGDNVQPTGRTTAYLTHDDEALYIAVRAEDEPGKVRYVVHPRDVVIEQGQDWIGIALDTFNDRRRAFGMAVNPIGIQGDGVLIEGGGFAEWDAVFETAGRVDDDRGGYAVEVRVPFRSLRFSRAAVQTWGLGLSRAYGRSGETDTPWPRNRDVACDLCQNAEILLEGIVPGHNLEVNPTLVARGEAERPEGGTSLGRYDPAAEPGLNLKYGVTPGLTLDATLNPDFSQVESDAGQLQVNNRFALFLPEKRPFFLEAGDLFATSIQPPGGSAGPPINLIHSRNIVDPDWGIKLSGKAGRLGLGLIAARDAAAPVDIEDAVGGSAVAVARARVDVHRESYVGAVLTARRHSGDDDLIGAMDARLRFGPNTTLRAIGAASRAWMMWQGQRAEEWRQRDGAAIQIQADHASRSWAGGLAVIDITEDFRAPLGFVPRTDQLLLAGAWSYIWQGEGMVQRVQPQLRYERIYEHDDDSRFFDPGPFVDELYEPSISIQLARATSIGAGYHRAYTFFEGRHFGGMNRYGGFFDSNALRWLSLNGSMILGADLIYEDRAYDDVARPGWFVSSSVDATLRLVPALRVGLNTQVSRIWRRTDQEARANLYARAVIPRLKAEYQVTRRLGLRGIAEWRNERYYREGGALHERDARLASEFLASYIISAGSACYLGWTDLRTDAAAGTVSPDRRGGVAKVSYLWRF